MGSPKFYDTMTELELRQVCEELDKTLVELMGSMKDLSSLRNKYKETVKEVSTVWSLFFFFRV